MIHDPKSPSICAVRRKPSSVHSFVKRLRGGLATGRVVIDRQSKLTTHNAVNTIINLAVQVSQ
jgi:hypothetical protein